MDSDSQTSAKINMCSANAMWFDVAIVSGIFTIGSIMLDMKEVSFADGRRNDLGTAGPF
jgi:hypothetical protein